MIIKEIEIKAFGRLEDRRMVFGDGVNLIQGENEAGKTTLHAFIRAMLFGMERGRGRASREDDYTRYRPWNASGNYGGRMDLEIGGKTYRMIRDFARDGRDLTVYDLETGAEVPEFEERVLQAAGLNQSNYRNALWITAERNPSTRELADGLGDRLIHMATGGDQELAASKAIAWLETEKKKQEKSKLSEKMTELEERKKILQEAEQERKELALEYQSVEEALYRNAMLSGERLTDEEEEVALERAAQISRAAAEARNLRQASEGGNMLAAVGYFLLAIGCLIVFAMMKWVLPLPVAIGVPVVFYLAVLGRGLYKSYQKKMQKKQNQAEREELILQKGKLSVRIEQLERQQEAENTLGEEYRQTREKLLVQQQEKEVLETAAEILRQVSGEVKQGFGREYAGRLERAMKEITAGGHEQLYLDEEFQIRLEENGQIQPLERFSKGTVEQIYLAMSLQAGALLFREQMPLLLDDALVHYDGERIQRVLEYMTREHRGQILLCSCTTREAECLEEAGIPYRYLHMREDLQD